MKRWKFSAYTLVELLIAMVLSLLLLLGMLQLFRFVSGMMHDTRTAINLNANLNAAALLLRQDLEQIPASLPIKPNRIGNGLPVKDRDGYLEITEGPNTNASHQFVNSETGAADTTAGDTDDIIAFTAKAEAGKPFRGLIGGNIAERYAAEVVWFVRGNTLYRRVLLIDDQSTAAGEVNSIEQTACREHRFGHGGETFPYPLYDPAALDSRYYLRMPLLEEMLHADWKGKTWDKQFPSSAPTEPTPDLWSQPYFYPTLQDKKSGALTEYVDSPRNPRAGEDAVLTNVLSFDIKVWDEGRKAFVDLGSGSWGCRRSELRNVWDSWTQQGDYAGKDPPYTEPLQAVKMTIRCFDPASKIVKQITVVHRFQAEP